VVVGNLPFLLTDTVGFIRKLPTQLVESFKSTLDEVREADLLVHVVDISHPAFEDHFNSVMQTVSELGASETPTLVVFNKIDAFTPEERDPFDLEVEEKGYANLEELRNSWMARTHNNAVFISAQKKINLEELRNTLYYMVKGISDERYPNLAF
jgi:GTP-binding protein HflX